MPKVLVARPPLDAAEEAPVRRLARSLHVSADWVLHARMSARSGDGLRTRAIAEALDCHPQTVRERFSALERAWARRAGHAARQRTPTAPHGGRAPRGDRAGRPSAPQPPGPLPRWDTRPR
jgi:hypothetical protein